MIAVGGDGTDMWDARLDQTLHAFAKSRKCKVLLEATCPFTRPLLHVPITKYKIIPHPNPNLILK